MLLRSIVSFVAAAGLTACGTMDNRASVAAVPAAAFASPTAGVAIFSTGAPDHCIATATFLRVFDAHTRKTVDSAPLIPVDVYVNKSEFSDHHGAVNAIALPAGDYYLSPWMANPYLVAVKIPEFTFSIGAGETVYLGEVFMPVSCSRSTAFVITDQFERDIPLATAKNPAVAGHAPVKRLLVGQPR